MADEDFRASMAIRIATPEDAPNIAAVHVESWRETYAGLMPEPVLRGLSVSERTGRWTSILGQPDAAGKTAVFVASQKKRVVGFISGGRQRDDGMLSQGFAGEISAIYVLRHAQGQGIGTSLMTAMARNLMAQGHGAASLWVLRNNTPARRFYESFGGEIVGEKVDQRETMSLIEIAYGWRDLSRISSPDGRGFFYPSRS